ncbi:MAG TPA: glycosyltransferase family 39 protein [Polyangiaceae bacterium]|nr:glycosyltransferase family 39 protein [Polyangiaceae bacterium]
MLDVAASTRPLSSRSALARGAGALALGALLALLGMLLKPPQLEFRWLEMVVAGSGVLLASAGALALVASLRRVQPAPAATVVPLSARAFVPGLAFILGSGAALSLLVHRAVAGVVPLPAISLGVGVPALCLGMLWGVHHCVAQLRAANNTDARLVSLEIVLAAFGVLLYMPTLGSFGLLDCWEPHYSEVAREMLARHDWISLWWGDQSWFWSKPILDFWLEGLSYTWFGLDPRPEGILSAVGAGLQPSPEWAARLPIAAMAIAGPLVLARGVAAHFGRRAALFAGLILFSCPYWFLLARQTMVDMAYAAPLSAVLGFLLLADASPEGERARTYRIELGGRSLSLSGHHLLFGTISALALAQIFYLLSRHVSFELGDAAGLHLHVDEVWTGSPGNCTLPGNEACRLDAEATHTRLQPGLSALVWAVCLGLLLWRERRERTLRGLYQIAAWTCLALATMGKGAPGLVLPLCTFGAWLALGGRLAALRDAKLPALGLILACVAAPWFVQEYARHGAPFFERLFLHDMVNRAFGHVHDTNAGVDTGFRYYVWQLGYGLFPWGGIAAAGALFCIAQSSRRGADARFISATQLLAAWLLACFGLFSIAGTKFHHYILPLVPAAAVFGAVLCDELWRPERSKRLLGFGLLALVPTILVARDLAAPGAMPGAAQLLHLFIYKYDRPWPAELVYARVFIATGVVVGIACLLLEAPRLRRTAVAGLLGAGVGFAAWGLNVYLLEIAPHWSQRATIGEYYRARSNPEQLLVAYRQNWMGENFYTGNHVATFKSGGDVFKRWIAERRRQSEHVLFFTTEHATVALLKREIGSFARFDLLTTPAQNNKFVLARVEL